MRFISKKDKEQAKNNSFKSFVVAFHYKRHIEKWFFFSGPRGRFPNFSFIQGSLHFGWAFEGMNRLLRKRRTQDSTLDCLFQHLTLARLQCDHSSHLLSWIICLCKHQLRPCQNPVMITWEPVGLPLGTHMLPWETTNFSLTQAAMKMSPMLDHSTILHVTAWARLPAQNSWQYRFRYTDMTGPFSEDKAHWSFIPYITLWHHHEPEQKHLEMTKVSEWGSHCLYFHPLNISTELSTRSLKLC